MNNDNLDDVLARLRDRHLPPAPDLRREVRAEITRLKARPSFWQRLLPVLHWNELLSQPRLAAFALALALVVGVVPGVLTLTVPSRTDEARIARASLYLDVFDSSWSNIPAVSPATPGDRR